jgi:Domain of unknown function (DUF362)
LEYWIKIIISKESNMLLWSTMSLIKVLMHRARHSFFLFGLLSILWFIFKTGTKPTRMNYPCQQASAAGGSLWLTTYAMPLVLAMRSPNDQKSKSKMVTLAGILLVLASLLYVSANFFNTPAEAEGGPAARGNAVGLRFSEKQAQSPEASDIFVVNGTSGNDDGIRELIGLMNANGLPFYAQNNSPGIIGRDDVVIIKVNSQWDERGGTNTDLVKALILAILDHPQGFSGEVVIADNGQAQYGSTGRGGSLNYAKNNAENTSQSMQKVADSFSGHRVSAYLWDAITSKRVKEYAQGDLQDGYVVDGAPSPQTGIVVTYPKFKTKFKTDISFKMGIWNPDNGTYDSKRLKVINVPVLKSHGGYGVTASVKHYMGVVSDKLSREEGGRAHSSVGSGGMGTEMAQTRFPALNILDAIWVNANPGSGPSTSYSEATKTSAIAASTDPIAIDYWAAKNILMPAAQAQGYNDLSSMDPDYISPGSFGDWLRLSRDEIRKAGYQVTKEDRGINVHVTQLKG